LKTACKKTYIPYWSFLSNFSVSNRVHVDS